MQKRNLGRSGLEVSALCLGGNVFGWTIDQATSFAVLDAFVAAGGNFIDTADVYSVWVPGHTGGESEAMIGSWIKARGNRHQVIIATKVGNEMAPDRKGLSRQHIMRSVDESLRRLQTDYIDLYQSHREDPGTPQEETLGAYQDLIRQGKVRAIGASNYSAPRLAEALRLSREQGLPRYESLQPMYNLIDRQGYEQELASLCRSEEVGVISFYALAAGFLTGKYRTEGDLAGRARGTRVARYMNPRGLRILEAMDRVAASSGASLAQIAVAWVMRRPEITAPIVSATSVEQLGQILSAPGMKLSEGELELLDRASAEQAE